jgi:hypothetical protein
MNKKIIGIIGMIIILILASVTNAFGGANTKGNQIIINDQFNDKEFSVKNIDETTIEIKVNPEEFEFNSVDTAEGLFTTVILPGYGFSSIEGKAKLPMIRKMVEIPHGSNPELIVTSDSWDEISLLELNLLDMILPVQPPVEKIPGDYNDFIMDDVYYSTDEFYPSDIANIVDIGEIRSRRFALVEISPVQYNPVSGELRLMNYCEITINLPNSDLIKTYNKIARYSTPNFERLFEVTFSNYGAYESGIINSDSKGYLIIVYDDFYSEIEPFAAWKTHIGYNTTVTNTSDIPGGATKENIHDYIEDAYDNWVIPPAYVLLVGDTPQIPTYSGSEGPDAVDLYYVTINSGDYFPDIFIGRFPASQESHVTAMVDKTLYYEQGNFSENDWIKKAAFMAGYDNYWITEETHNYVISMYLEPEKYDFDKLYRVTYDATKQDVANAINNGRSLAIFSGHGYLDSWDDGPPFNPGDVQSLTNEGKYPFVCSHACLTGSFQISECFGETWLRQPDKAGLAFWGASEGTTWYEDDVLEKGMFQAWWDDGLEWIGGMTDMGLYYVYENYSGGGLSKYYFEAYNILGDPSVKIWTYSPSGEPSRPDKPSGPVIGRVNFEYNFTSSTIDPNGDKIYYMWNWGDGNFSEWIGPYDSGDTCEASYIWKADGEFEVKVKAMDENDDQSNWSNSLIITIYDTVPPDKPIVSGPTRLFPFIPYTFKFNTIDPDGEDVYYWIDWGDDEIEYWIGPHKSGEVVSLSHKYTTLGAFNLTVKAKDINDFESEMIEWPIKVSLSRNRMINNRFIFTYLEKFIVWFPLLEQFLRN